jgi:hypothetical protein
VLAHHRPEIFTIALTWQRITHSVLKFGASYLTRHFAGYRVRKFFFSHWTSRYILHCLVSGMLLVISPNRLISKWFRDVWP